MRLLMVLFFCLLNAPGFAQIDPEIKKVIEEKLGFKFMDISLYPQLNSDLWYSNEGIYLKEGVVLYDIQKDSKIRNNMGKAYDGMSFCTIQDNGWMSYEKGEPCLSETDFYNYLLKSVAAGKSNVFITNNQKKSKYSPRINRIDISSLSMSELKKKQQAAPDDNAY